MLPKYIEKIGEGLSLRIKQVNSVWQLHTDGSTIPFIARYRKEATGNLDEVQIAAVIEQIQYFEELEKRKQTVLKTIEGLGKLTPELQQHIDNCFEAAVLEDIYLPYKPKRKTLATTAIEKGLEPLAKQLFEQQSFDIEATAQTYINKRVKNIAEALKGSRDIIAEWIAEHEQARNIIRQLFQQGAILYAKVLNTKKQTEDAQKYKDYFEFKESLQKCPSHRILAIRRGEKEGFLAMDISIDKTIALEALAKLFITINNNTTQHQQKVIEDSYDRLLKPSIENEFRIMSKSAADDEAIRVFTENLRQLLLAPPLGAKRVLALDPGFRTGCKLVCLDEQGSLLHHTTVYPHPPQNEQEKTIAVIQELVNQYNIQAISIGNGTAGRETAQLIRSITFNKPVSVFIVNEAGASIYSASEIAREEFPDQDVTVRGSISIGRRLLDPLSELVKIDAKSIGVGQYQHDVNQIKLQESLDRTVESCVNHVGVDINTASKHLLMYVSGLGANIAKSIIKYRTTNGPFKSRAEMKNIPLLGSKTFEQCAGFLRIRNADNPLDNSAVHPESYAVVESMANTLHCTIQDLITQPSLRKQIQTKDYITETVGAYTVEDIIQELEKPGLDPRSIIEEFHFAENVHTINDLKVGMILPGIVSNITNFGVFVDVGVKQDGLVHLSHLSNQFVSNPADVVKLQQKVQVSVLEVDVARKRISLSMKNVSDNSANKKPIVQKQAPQRQVPQQLPENKNDFQDKLMQLKAKFNA